MDLQSLLYDPIYSVIGVDAVLTLPTGELIELVVLDKTAGIDTGDGVNAPTIVPAAVVRMVELVSTNGIALKRLSDKNAKISFNGFTWRIESYRLRPSPKGENDGEVYLLLSQKKEGETMKPGVFDFDHWRGTTEPFTIQLKSKDAAGVEVNLPFDDVRLTITDLEGTLILRKSISTDPGGIVVTDEDEAEVSWVPTVAESRLIPLGANCKYEWEVRNGSSQQVYLVGTITGFGGVNDD